MKVFAQSPFPAPLEYRFNPAVFYLKFVKRNALINDGGFILPIDHFEQLCQDPAHKGAKGGLNISLKKLQGRCLKHQTFISY